MKTILKYIVLILVISTLTSCTSHYTMRGDTFTVVSESVNYPDSLSKYVLQYKDNRMAGTGEPKSELEVIFHKDAFEVGDKVKLIKVEE